MRQRERGKRRVMEEKTRKGLEMEKGIDREQSEREKGRRGKVLATERNKEEGCKDKRGRERRQTRERWRGTER